MSGLFIRTTWPHTNEKRAGRERLLLCLLAALLLSTSYTSAQGNGDAKISGKVISRFSLGGEEGNGTVNNGGPTFEVPVSDAKISITAEKQSFRLKTGITGNFNINRLPSGSIHLSIVKEGYEDFSEDVTLTPGDNVVIVELKQAIETLTPAVKTEEVPLVSMRGDTLVFNATAIPLQESDYAIDLLRQFPGVEIKNGQIAVYGKSVSRTYVNGALIFGSSPISALENIKGSEVLTMDVYDEKGIPEKKDGIEREKDKVINIKTRNPILSVTDVRALAYAGADVPAKKGESSQTRYSLSASGKFFSETFQMTGEVVGSNIGMSSLSSKIPYSLPNYQETENASLTLEKHFKDALMGDALRISYSYNDSWSKRESKKETEYFGAGEIPGRNVFSSSASKSKLSSHNFNVNARIWTNPKFELSVSSFLSFSETDNRIVRSEKTIIQEMSLSQNPLERSKDNSWRAGGSLSFTPIINKKRLFLLEGSYMREERKSPSSQSDTLSSSYVRRHLVREGNGMSEDYSLSISKLLFQKVSQRGSVGLRLSYGWTHTKEERDRLSYNLFPIRTDDPAGTYDYTYTITGNLANVEFNFSRNSKSRGSLSLAAISHKVGDTERFPASPKTGKTTIPCFPAHP